MQMIQPLSEQPSFTKYFLEDPSLVDRVDHKQKKKIVLYDLPQIELYRKLNKPMVSEEKKRIIKEKLDLQQESLLQTKERQRRNEYFLNFSENPFVDLAPHLKIPGSHTKAQNGQKLQLQKSAKQQKQLSLGIPIPQPDPEDIKSLDIVTQLNSMVEKKPKTEFLKMKEDFKTMMKDAGLFSNKIIEISAKKEEFQFFHEKKSTADKFISMVLSKGLGMASEKTRKTQKDRLDQRTRGQQQKNFKKESGGKPMMQILPDNIMSFQEIIKIKQENYFMRQDPLSLKPMNVFKVSFNKNQKQMVGKQLLNKYNFSFTSMVQKLQKIKIPIYRDISRMSRRISLGKSTQKQDRFDYIDSYELSFKTNALTFADLMSVASFRFTPEFVYKTTNFDVEQNVVKETSETSSQQQQEQIFYSQNTDNMSVRFHNKGQQQQEILNYLKLQYNGRQVNYQNQCQRFKQAISSQLKMKEKLVSTTIQDKKLHGGINLSIKKQLKRFVNMDQRQIQIDRLIRMNKTNKSKNVSIKLGKILQIFDIKKNHDEVIHKLGILEDDNQTIGSDDDDQNQTNQEGKEKLKLRPRTSLNPNTAKTNTKNTNNTSNKQINYNATSKNKQTNNNTTSNNKQTNYNTPKFGQDYKPSKTPQKVSNIQNSTSRTPTKKYPQFNTSRTPQRKKQSETQDRFNKTTSKSTVQKVGAWKF